MKCSHTQCFGNWSCKLCLVQVLLHLPQTQWSLERKQKISQGNHSGLFKLQVRTEVQSCDFWRGLLGGGGISKDYRNFPGFWIPCSVLFDQQINSTKNLPAFPTLYSQIRQLGPNNYSDATGWGQGPCLGNHRSIALWAKLVFVDLSALKHFCPFYNFNLLKFKLIIHSDMFKMIILWQEDTKMIMLYDICLALNQISLFETIMWYNDKRTPI